MCLSCPECDRPDQHRHGQVPLPFTEVEAGPNCEFAVLVTALEDERLTVAQLCRRDGPPSMGIEVSTALEAVGCMALDRSL